MKNLKRTLCLCLSIVLCVAMMVPAFAEPEGTHSITIRPGDHTESGNETRFKAYQIFTGQLEEDEGSSQDEGVDSASRKLSHIEWGDGVNHGDVVEAMKTDVDKFPDFKTEWEKWNSSQLNQWDDATVVARYLAEKGKDRTDGYGDDTVEDAFNALLAQHLVEENGKESTRQDDDGNWVISGLASGYYFITDQLNDVIEGGSTSDVRSSYILDVVGDRTISIKSSLPTAEKTVTGGAGNPADKSGNIGPTADENNEFTFTIKGTLPENYADFETYQYVIKDTVPAGITPDMKSLQVFVGETQVSTGYTVTPADGTLVEGQATNIEVTFADLKKVEPTVSADSVIKVTYKAHLNRFATAGSTNPNTNKATITFSNDPYTSGTGTPPGGPGTPPPTGTTVETETHTYTLALDITKTNDESQPMQNVEFYLRDESGSKYAILEKSGDNTAYVVKRWVEAAQKDSALTDGELARAVTGEGGKVQIRGLVPGTYSMEEYETSATAGYDPIKPFAFTLTASVNEEGKLTDSSATAAAGSATRDDATIQDTNSDGVYEITFVNYKAPILPHTGGIGVYVLYAIGAGILAAGAGLVIWNRRRTTD